MSAHRSGQWHRSQYLEEHPAPNERDEDILCGGDTKATTAVAEVPAGARVAVLFGAVAGRRRVRFRYRDTERQVDPWRLASPPDPDQKLLSPAPDLQNQRGQ